MMFPRAAIVGAPLSVGQGEAVPLTYAMLASGLAAGPTLTLQARLGRPVPAPVALSCPALALRIAPVYVAFWIGWTVLAGAPFPLAGRCQCGQDRGQCSRPTNSGSLVR